MIEMTFTEFVDRYTLEEKLFIVPTRRIGLLMINNMAKEGKNVLNLNPITLRRLSEEICARYMEENNVLYIDELIGKSLILDCLKTLSQDSDFFFEESLIDEKTAEEVYKVIMELKSKRIDDFPKEKDLDRIYSLYSLRLKELNAMDSYDIMMKAKDLPELNLYRDKIIGVAGNIEFHNLEKELFQALKGEIIKIRMPVQKLMDSPKEYFFKEQEGKLKLDKNIKFFSGYGIRNEIKYIIDDIFKKKIPLDEVVITYTDQKYIEEIDLEFKKHGLGVNLADGLDILKSSTYRFIKTIFEFAKNYYNITELKALFFNGSLDMEELQLSIEDISSGDIYEDLIASKIFYGRESYESLNLIKSGEDSRDILISKWVREFFSDVLDMLPEVETDFKTHTDRLIELLKKYVRISSSYDERAKESIIDKLKTISEIPLTLERDEYLNTLLSYIEDININRSGVNPSIAFACKYTIAGYTGRKHLYMIGLDSATLASKIVESPILLDSSRRDISPDLSFSKESYKYKKYKIREALTADFENISIGYSNFDMVNVKGKTASNIYIELREAYEGEQVYLEKDERLLGEDLVYSGTTLETLGQCSRKRYLQSRLGLIEKEELEIDLDRWLDPMSKGSLVHGVLNEFFDLNEKNRTEEILFKLIDNRAEEKKIESPVILDEVYNKEIEDMKSFCKVMFEREKASNLEVFINELSFGIAKINKVFGYLDAQSIKIGDTILNIRGAIDRVDIDREKKIFIIRDYKTGKLKNFDERLRTSSGGGKNRIHDYSSGQKFQFYIYKKVLDNIIAREDSFKDYKVEGFAYEFYENSLELILDSDLIQTIEDRIIELLNLDIFENDKSIVYDEDDSLTCAYCEFKNICKIDRDVSKVRGGWF